jgi:hypothetical protein
MYIFILAHNLLTNIQKKPTEKERASISKKQSQKKKDMLYDIVINTLSTCVKS